jgi:hypothetical protein
MEELLKFILSYDAEDKGQREHCLYRGIFSVLTFDLLTLVETSVNVP